jgi:membrane protein DedA with SNARE-associated domain
MLHWHFCQFPLSIVFTIISAIAVGAWTGYLFGQSVRRDLLVKSAWHLLEESNVEEGQAQTQEGQTG